MLTNKQIDEINRKHFEETFREIDKDYQLIKIGEEHLTAFNYNEYMIIAGTQVLIKYECCDKSIYRASSDGGVLQFPSTIRIWVSFMQAVDKELQSL